MLRSGIPFALFASLLLTNGCAPAPPPDTRAADEAAIKASDEQWSAAAGKHDVDAAVAPYAEDAVLLPPNAPLAKDPKSIREAWAGMLGPNVAVSWTASKIEVAKAGDLAYSYGTYAMAITDPKGGPAINDRGKFLEIWRKQADGKWKCIVDTFNSDLPLPAPPPEKKK